MPLFGGIAFVLKEIQWMQNEGKQGNPLETVSVKVALPAEVEMLTSKKTKWISRQSFLVLYV